MTMPRSFGAALLALGAVATPGLSRLSQAQTPHPVASSRPAAAPRSAALVRAASRDTLADARTASGGPGVRPVTRARGASVTPRTAPETTAASVASAPLKVATSPRRRVYSDTRVPITKGDPTPRLALSTSAGTLDFTPLAGSTRGPVGGDEELAEEAVPPGQPRVRGGFWLPRTFFGALLGGAGLVAVTRRGGSTPGVSAGTATKPPAGPTVLPPGTPATPAVPGAPGTPAAPAAPPVPGGPALPAAAPPMPAGPLPAFPLGPLPGLPTADEPLPVPPVPPPSLAPRVVPPTTTVPEPATVLLVGGGLAALAVRQRRPRR
jgi:hypothetical protein